MVASEEMLLSLAGNGKLGGSVDLSFPKSSSGEQKKSQESDQRATGRATTKPAGQFSAKLKTQCTAQFA